MAQGPSDITLDMDHVIIEMGARNGGSESSDAGPSNITLGMDRVITETGTRNGGSESSGTSEIIHDSDQVMAETSTRERQSEPTGGAGTGGQDSEIVIRKVPRELSVNDENSYTPHYVPIGPYHVSNSYPGIQEEKQNSVDHLQSLSEQQGEGGLTGLAEQLEPLVRACYPSSLVRMTAEEWSTMLLRDGCYLLGCMVDYTSGNSDNDHQGQPAASSISRNDGETSGDSVSSSAPQGPPPPPPASSNNGTASAQAANDRVARSSCRHEANDNTVVRDTVFLVDNQIPFFVLQRIHERVKGGTPPSSVLEPVADYVQEVLQELLYISKHPRPPPTPPTPRHVLHLLHSYLQPTSPPPAMEEDAAARPRTGRWRRATEYCMYGNVRFRRREFRADDESWTFLDVRLQEGTLWVPPLRVDNMTWTVLRNLMALEQQTPGKKKKPVTAYCVFMSQVACKVEDVVLLQRQEILEQFLVNDEEVAHGFANLCKGVVLDIDNDDTNYLKPLWHELHALCNHPTNFAMGSFHQKYCTDPVYLAAFVIAGFLFLFELAQVILPIPAVQKHLQ